MLNRKTRMFNSPVIILDQPRTNCSKRVFLRISHPQGNLNNTCIKIYLWEVTENRGFKTPGFVTAWKRGLEQAFVKRLDLLITKTLLKSYPHT